MRVLRWQRHVTNIGANFHGLTQDGNFLILILAETCHDDSVFANGKRCELHSIVAQHIMQRKNVALHSGFLHDSVQFSPRVSIWRSANMHAG